LEPFQQQPKQQKVVRNVEPLFAPSALIVKATFASAHMLSVTSAIHQFATLQFVAIATSVWYAVLLVMYVATEHVKQLAHLVLTAERLATLNAKSVQCVKHVLMSAQIVTNVVIQAK
jgi:hypothetical protein